MSQASVQLANTARLASEERSRSVSGATVLEQYQHVIPTPIGVGPRLRTIYLAAAGGPGIEMVQDGSVTPVNFDLAPADPAIYRVSRLTLLMRLAAQPLMTQFGTLAALTNGLLVEVRDASGVLADLLGGQPLKSNDDLATYFDLSVADLGASHTLRADWRFAFPVRLEGALGEFLRVSVRDAMAGITRMRCLAELAVETDLT